MPPCWIRRGNNWEIFHNVIKASNMSHTFDAFITIRTISQLFPPLRPFIWVHEFIFYMIWGKHRTIAFSVCVNRCVTTGKNPWYFFDIYESIKFPDFSRPGFFHKISWFPWYSSSAGSLLQCKSRAPFEYKDYFPVIELPITKIRLSHLRRIFIMGISTLAKLHLYIKTAPPR